MDFELLKNLSSFGFAAVVAFYLLTQTTNAINRNTAAINKLQSSIEHLIREEERLNWLCVSKTESHTSDKKNNLNSN